MLLSGLAVDTALPVPFGLFSASFLALGTLIALTRARFRAEHNYHPVLLAHGSNLCCIALLTLSAGSQLWAAPAFWQQIALTTLLSHAVLLALAPWFFKLERLLFELCHLTAEPEDFPPS